MNEIDIWTDQNRLAALTMSDHQLALAENYVTDHAGNMRVLGYVLPGHRYMKMHDSWGDDDKVCVHIYGLHHDGAPDGDPDEQTMLFPTGNEAFRVFLALVEAGGDGLDPMPPKMRVTVTHTFEVSSHVSEHQLHVLVGTMTVQVEEPVVGLDGSGNEEGIETDKITSTFTTEYVHG